MPSPSPSPSPTTPTEADASVAFPFPLSLPHGHHAQRCSSVAAAADDDEQQKNSRRRASVEAELRRLKQLPAASSYAAHRLRVLGKVMHLLSLPPQTRTLSEAEELEILFSSLSL